MTGQATADVIAGNRRSWVAAGCAAGVIAPLFYAAVVAVGGWMTPGYSPLANMISELTMSVAPGRVPLAALFVLYNLLVIGFALALPAAMPSADRRWVRGGAALLVVIAIAGVGMVTVFPTDRPVDPLTATGWVHVALASVASLGTMAAVFAFGWALRRVPAWHSLALFSFVCLAAIAMSGVWTAVTAAQLSPVMGLAERVTIGAFMVWLFGFALALARRRVV